MVALTGIILALNSLSGIKPISPEESKELIAKSLPINPKDQLTPKNAHPKAAALMTESFYWNCADDNSPFGNDNGADALSEFHIWRKRHPTEKPEIFINDLCEKFQARFSDWNETTPEGLNTIFGSKKSYAMTTGDDIIISVAFAQLMIEGKVDNSLKQLAFVAIGKEEAANTIERRGWVNPEERKQRLIKFRNVLQAAEEKN